MTKSLHPDISPEDLDTVSTTVKDFLARATPDTDITSDTSKHRMMQSVITSVLSKQQLFGILTTSDQDSFTTDTSLPQPAERLLMQKCFDGASSSIAIILDLFTQNPEGTVVKGSTGHSIQALNEEKQIAVNVDFNVIESLLLRAAVGDYVLNLHNIFTQDDQRESLLDDLLDDVGLSLDKVRTYESELDPALNKMKELGAIQFFPTGEKLMEALENHVTGEQHIIDTMCATDVPDLPDVDKKILAHQLAEVMQPLIDNFPTRPEN
jgi:hypothetical protein